MRLIDADKLIEGLKKYTHTNNCEFNGACHSIIEFIKKQPTDYDVDKVVEQLEVRKEVYYEKFEDHMRGANKEIAKNYFTKFNMVDDIVRIVKRGGIND